MPQVLRNRPLEALLAYFTVSAMHLYSLAPRTMAGSAERALACMPVLLINLFMPFLVDRHSEPCLFIVAVFAVAWQANFKARPCMHGTYAVEHSLLLQDKPACQEAAVAS